MPIESSRAPEASSIRTEAGAELGRGARAEVRARLAEFTSDIGKILTEADDADAMLRGCAQALVDHLGAAFGRIWTLSDDGRILHLRASAGMYTHLDGPHGRVPVGSLKIGRIASERTALLTNDVLDDPSIGDKQWAQREGMRSFAGHPLQLGTRVLGVMAMFSRHPLDPETGAALASAANLVALGIERWRGDARLRRQADLLEQTHDAVLVWQLGGEIEYWNRAAEQLYGYTRDEAIGSSSHQLLKTRHPGGAGLFGADLQREGQWFGELIHTRSDGTEVLVESRHVLIHEPDGRPLVLETTRDITEPKRVEMEREKLIEDLAGANAVKDEFVGLVSHELRTPITTIYGNARILLEYGNALDAADRDEAIADIEGEADRLQRIVENLLILARFDHTETIETEPVQIGNAVQAAVAGFRRRHPLRAINVEVEAGLPIADVQPTYLELVITNLLSNADKYSPPGAAVDVRVARGDAEIKVFVMDRGQGILPEELDEVFSPFYRSNRTKSLAGGMGIGLAVCRRVMEAQGCRIWANPREGGGSVFGFSLPQEPADA